MTDSITTQTYSIFESVAKIRKFHDSEYFLESSSSPNLKTRTIAVENRAKPILAELDGELSKQGEIRKSQLLFLRGQLLQLQTSEYSKAAETALQTAVKLDPTHVDAWNELGEAYWRGHDAQQAKSCFEHALKHSNNENAAALCKLSMLLRQLPYESDKERIEALVKSLDLARKALKLDLNNGDAWYTLGNAQMALTFYSMCDIKKPLTAYNKAVQIDPAQKYNPDLHFNRAQLLVYQGKFCAALTEFQKAASIDTEWEDATAKVTAIEDHLITVAAQIRDKGKLKQRKLKQLATKLKNPENLRCGVVVSSISPTPHVLAFSAVCMLPEDKYIVVRITNLKNGGNIIIGDTLEFAKEQEVCQTDQLVRGESLQFDYVSITKPETELLVNGHRISANQASGLTSISKPPPK